MWVVGLVNTLLVSKLLGEAKGGQCDRLRDQDLDQGGTPHKRVGGVFFSPNRGHNRVMPSGDWDRKKILELSRGGFSVLQKGHRDCSFRW